jgi:K+-sensing histidine kinase KdpD
MTVVRLSPIALTQLTGYLASLLGVAAIAASLSPFHAGLRVVIPATILLMLVLLVAIRWGTGPALFCSVLAVIYLNAAFVPLDLDELTDNGNLAALFAFATTSLAVGQLSARAEKRARENQALYEQLRAAVEKTSQMEALRQSEKLKSALLDTVTHDLRTPLTSIKASASALLASEAPQAQTPATQYRGKLLKIVVEQSDRLNRIIEGMLELAKVEAGGLTAGGEAVSMEEIIMAALARAEHLVSERKITLCCDERLLVTVNAKAVAQLIHTLVENAAKYSPVGTEIRITAEQTDDSALRVSVTDGGAGIAPEFREKIFAKFFRVAPDEDESSKGLGLGLAIAQGIVDAHGGKIWAQSREDGKTGAEFVFTIPACVQEAPSLEPEAETI